MGLNTAYYDKEMECESRFRKDGPFWHLCTPGEVQEIIFIEEADFRYAITALGLALSALRENTGATMSCVVILAYAVMSNHIHLILAGPKEACLALFEEWKRLLKKYFARQGRILSWRNFEIAEPIQITDLRMLRTELAYCNRNGFVEGLCPTPFTYPWGSGQYYFSMPQAAGMPFNELPYNVKRSMLQSRAQTLPKEYKAIEGMLDPRSFCQFDKGMAYFSNGYFYFSDITRNMEAFSESAKRLKDRVFLTDSELYVALLQLCKRNFGVNSPKELDPNSKLETAKLLHTTYNATNGQICRLLHLQKAIVDQLFPQKTRKR